MKKDAEKEAVMELKQELQRVRILLEALTVSDDDDELELQVAESAIHTLRALKELKQRQSDRGLKLLKNLGIRRPPQEFLCPISGLLMTHPSIADGDETYDNESLPKSCLELKIFDTLTPNDRLKEEILKWCLESQVPFIHDKGFEKMSAVELRRGLVEQGNVDGVMHLTDAAVMTLYGLRESWHLQYELPQEFLCPISGIAMNEPVVTTSGQTFNVTNIQKCPKTGQLLFHTVLTPNLLIKKMIANWFIAIHLDPPVLLALLTELPSLSPFEQTAKLKEIRLKTALLPSFRALLTDVSPLLTPFVISKCHSNKEMCNDVLAIILNISTDDTNKGKIVEDCPSLIPFLIECLGEQNCVENRGLAAAALCELSAVDANKAVIGESGAVGPLIKLLGIGHPLASREAAGAVLSLCTLVANKDRVLPKGGLVAVIHKLDNPQLLDVVLEILALFSSHPLAVEVMEERGVVPRLFRVIAESKSGLDEENSVAVIFGIGSSSKTSLSMIEDVDNAMEILDHVAKNGTNRASKIATDLVSRIRDKDLPDSKIRTVSGELRNL